MPWSGGFSIMYILLFLDIYIVANIYNMYLDLKKIIIIANLHFFFPRMYHLSYFDIKHGNQRGGVKLPPSSPQRILVFKYPNRVKNERFQICSKQRTKMPIFAPPPLFIKLIMANETNRGFMIWISIESLDLEQSRKELILCHKL